MIKPLLQGEALASNIRQFSSDPENFHLWWLGQSGFLLAWNGQRLLFDPYLSDSLTRKYAATDKPHVRMTELVIAPEQLPPVDVVTSTHNHTDHLDAETLQAVLSGWRHSVLVIPEANRSFVAERLQLDADFPIGLDHGGTTKIGHFTIHAVPAAHEQVEKDENGRCRFLGYVVQFGKWTVYHSGDTILFDGMTDILRKWPIDVAFLPINGRGPERKVAGNLDGAEAARLAKDIGARLVIPCHFEMFEFNTASPDLFRQSCEALSQPCQILRAGEHWSSASLVR